MNTLKKVTIGFLLSVVTFPALAADYAVLSPKTIQYLGVHKNNSFYVKFDGTMPGNCLYGVIYIEAEKKSLAAQFLAARVNNMPITRIDYSQDGNGVCSVTLAQF